MTTRDVTPLLHAYRECARHVWNTSFRLLGTPEQPWLGEDLFVNVEAELFAALVLAPLGRASERKPATGVPLAYLRIVPETATGVARVLWARGAAGVWQWAERDLWVDGLDLRFLDCFDWAATGYRDWQYLRARVVACAEASELVGADALIEALRATVLMEEGP